MKISMERMPVRRQTGERDGGPATVAAVEARPQFIGDPLFLYIGAERGTVRRHPGGTWPVVVSPLKLFFSIPVRGPHGRFLITSQLLLGAGLPCNSVFRSRGRHHKQDGFPVEKHGFHLLSKTHPLPFLQGKATKTAHEYEIC